MFSSLFTSKKSQSAASADTTDASASLAGAILLPRLGDASQCDANMPVKLCLDTAQSVHAMPLHEALRICASLRNRSVAILLHPADAPVHTVSLPPVPAAKRDLAIRAAMSDAVLQDARSLTRLSLALGAHRYAVAYVLTNTLSAIQSVLKDCGAEHVLLSSAVFALPQSVNAVQGDEDNHGGLSSTWLVQRDAAGHIYFGGVLPANLAKSALDTAPLSLDAVAWQMPHIGFVPPAQANAPSVWRWTVRLAMLCFFVAGAGQWLETARLRQQAQSLNQGINAAFIKAMPNTPLVDAEAQLAKQNKGNAASPFEQALSAPEHANLSATSVKRMVWAGGKLVLEKNAGDKAALEKSAADKNNTLGAQRPMPPSPASAMPQQAEVTPVGITNAAGILGSPNIGGANMGGANAGNPNAGQFSQKLNSRIARQQKSENRNEQNTSNPSGANAGISEGKAP